MKDIMKEANDNRFLVESLVDKKQDLINCRSAEMKKAYEEIISKYYRPLYENELELEMQERLLNETNKKVSQLSKFHTPYILDAIDLILNSLEEGPFVRYDTHFCNYLDDSYDIIKSDGGMFVIAHESIAKEFDSFYHSSGKRFLSIPRDKEDEIIIIKGSKDPIINEKFITFYDSRGDKTVDTKGHDCIYEFIDFLINKRYHYSDDFDPKKVYYNQAKAFLENYALKETQESQKKLIKEKETK